MRQDIYGGIKNALERGQSLEQAVKSFINAGYSELEVKQVASQFTSGTLSSVYPTNKIVQNNSAPQPPAQPMPNPQKLEQYRQPSNQNTSLRQPLRPVFQSNYQISDSHKKTGLGLILFLSLLLLILIFALGATIFFKNEIIFLLQNLI